MLLPPLFSCRSRHIFTLSLPLAFSPRHFRRFDYAISFTPPPPMLLSPPMPFSRARCFFDYAAAARCRYADTPRYAMLPPFRHADYAADSFAAAIIFITPLFIFDAIFAIAAAFAEAYAIAFAAAADAFRFAPLLPLRFHADVADVFDAVLPLPLPPLFFTPLPPHAAFRCRHAALRHLRFCRCYAAMLPLLPCCHIIADTIIFAADAYAMPPIFDSFSPLLRCRRYMFYAR